MNPPIPAQEPPEPYHFCTYFDRNYLTRGLALYQSLREHCRRPFVLWTLCFDDESLASLGRLDLEGMRLISRADFEAGDAELAAARANRTAVEYYWTCTPSLPLYILRQDESIKLITYLDADLFFFSDPQPIFDEFGQGSILIHGHRYAADHTDFAATSGIYNVGLLSFRCDTAGLECLHWWRERCNEWCYAHYEDGKLGDQKYLDDWPDRFADVVILENPGAGLAPWNMARYQITKNDGKIRVDGGPLIFFHFHALKVTTRHIASISGEVYYYPIICLTAIVRPYLEAIQKESLKCGSPFVDSFAPHGRRHILRGMLHQSMWKFDGGTLSKLFWYIGGKNREAGKSLILANKSISDGDLTGGFYLIKRSLIMNPLALTGKPFRQVFCRYFSAVTRVDRLRRFFTLL